jgi:hypothetical protein
MRNDPSKTGILSLCAFAFYFHAVPVLLFSDYQIFEYFFDTLLALIVLAEVRNAVKLDSGLVDWQLRATAGRSVTIQRNWTSKPSSSSIQLPGKGLT